MNENNVPNNENNVFNNGGFSQFEAADGPLSVSDKADMQADGGRCRGGGVRGDGR